MPKTRPAPGFDEGCVDEKTDYRRSKWDRIAATLSRSPFRLGTDKL